MNITEVKQYNHKIGIIEITNNNSHSLYNYLITKITLKDVPSYNTIRFSYEPNSQFIPHQQIDHDFFMQIPNQLNSTPLYIYVHYFLKELYEYEDDTIVHALTDFSKMNITSNHYKSTITDKNTLKVDYLLDNISRNPNWKNVVQTDSVSGAGVATEKGHYPLDSKYRITDFRFFNEPVQKTEADSKTYYEWPNTITDTTAQWKAVINSDKISSYITDKDQPLNMYMEYKFLPSSSEYHEHYIGLKSSTPALSDPIVSNTDNIKLVNEGLGESTYRVARYGDPMNNEASMLLKKDNSVNFLFNPIPVNDGCKITKDVCGDYFKFLYNGTNNGISNQTIKLDTNSSYTLTYFIYIPFIITSDNNYYIEIDGNKVEDKFLNMDKILYRTWNYHEINFTPKSEDVDIITHLCYDDNQDLPIYIYNVQITKDSVYSPLIKYNKANVLVQEDNKFAYKPYSTDITKVSYPYGDNQYKVQDSNLSKIPVIDVYALPDMSYIMNDTDIYLGYYSNTITEVGASGNLYYNKKEKRFEKSDGTQWVVTPIICAQGPNEIVIHTLNIYDNEVKTGTVSLSIEDADERTIHQYGESVINEDTGLSSIYANLGNYELNTNYYLNIKYSDPDCPLRVTNTKILMNVTESQITLTPTLYDGTNYIPDNLAGSTVLANWNNVQYATLVTKLVFTVETLETSVGSSKVSSGNMSLYIDDVLIETTRVDDGIADFFVDNTIITASGTYVLKFEYRSAEDYYPDKTIYKTLQIV